MEELAIVTQVNAQSVSVTSEVKSACSGCQQVDQCGSGQVAKAFPTKKLSLVLHTELPVKVGDTVILGLSDSCLLHSAWQVYLFPLFGLIAFAGIGQYLIAQSVLSHELLAVLLSMFGGYLGYALAKNRQSSPKNKVKLTPKILRIISDQIPTKELN